MSIVREVLEDLNLARTDPVGYSSRARRFLKLTSESAVEAHCHTFLEGQSTNVVAKTAILNLTNSDPSQAIATSSKLNFDASRLFLDVVDPESRTGVTDDCSWWAYRGCWGVEVGLILSRRLNLCLHTFFFTGRYFSPARWRKRCRRALRKSRTERGTILQLRLQIKNLHDQNITCHSSFSAKIASPQGLLPSNEIHLSHRLELG